MARDQRTNRRIRAREVRVVGSQGEQLGVLSIEAALERSQAEGLDLVEVNPMSKPPVCKIMDYGRFKYEEKKKANDAKKKQIVIKVKEVKLRPKTEEHDYDFKIRNVKTFLEEGHKAKITIMFRGREITHRELGTAVLDDVIKDTKDIAVIETPPRMEGRQMFMIIAPNSKVAQRARDAHRQQAIAHEKEKEAHRAEKHSEHAEQGGKDDGQKPGGSSAAPPAGGAPPAAGSSTPPAQAKPPPQSAPQG
ncbi:MAG: translation initiation factor IF-3 [Archangiaceae bacterium]|nr:translation initiation factor IF-3 [Archangiaceae bacterium]